MSYFTLNIDISDRRRDTLLPHVCSIFREASGQARLEFVTFDSATPKVMKVRYSGHLSPALRQALTFQG